MTNRQPLQGGEPPLVTIMRQRFSAASKQNHNDDEEIMPAKTVTRQELYDATATAFDRPPATKEDMIIAAVHHHGRRELMAELSKIPDDRRFQSIRDIWRYLPDVPVGD